MINLIQKEEKLDAAVFALGCCAEQWRASIHIGQVGIDTGVRQEEFDVWAPSMKALDQ